MALQYFSNYPLIAPTQELNGKGVKLQKGKKMLPLRGSVRETMQRYFGNTLDKVFQDFELKQRQQHHLQQQRQQQQQHLAISSGPMQSLSSDQSINSNGESDMRNNDGVEMHLGLE